MDRREFLQAASGAITLASPVLSLVAAIPAKPRPPALPTYMTCTPDEFGEIAAQWDMTPGNFGAIREFAEFVKLQPMLRSMSMSPLGMSTNGPGGGPLVGVRYSGPPLHYASPFHDAVTLAVSSPLWSLTEAERGNSLYRDHVTGMYRTVLQHVRHRHGANRPIAITQPFTFVMWPAADKRERPWFGFRIETVLATPEELAAVDNCCAPLLGNTSPQVSVVPHPTESTRVWKRFEDACCGGVK